MAEREFVLPDLGEGLEEAVLSAWLVAEGDQVQLNQPFVEIETAKATVEIPSPHAGRIARLHAATGATIAVGAPLVTFEVADVEPSHSATPTGGAVAATPAVRKLAKERGVELAALAGTGPDGRITRDDVEAAASDGAPATDFELVEVPLVRRAIADTLTRVAAIPQVTTFRTVDCHALESFRRELDTSPLPIFVAALASIAGSHPWINASWTGQGIRLHRPVNVGIATDTERGLVVPILRDATSRGIAGLAEEIARLAERARSNALAHDELTGATIAVTNTGSYGSEFGTPLLNPGHAVTVALGHIAPRALVVDGRVLARPACTLSLTFDHRVLDGATVGRALGDLVDMLSSPDRLQALPR